MKKESKLNFNINGKLHLVLGTRQSVAGSLKAIRVLVKKNLSDLETDFQKIQRQFKRVFILRSS